MSDHTSPKLPSFQFYTGDWFKDTHYLSFLARNTWHDIMVVLWDSPTRGVLALSINDWSKVVGISEADVKKAIRELSQKNTCEILTLNDGRILFASRRFIREDINRDKDRDRKRKERKQKKTGLVSLSRIAKVYPEFLFHLAEIFPEDVFLSQPWPMDKLSATGKSSEKNLQGEKGKSSCLKETLDLESDEQNQGVDSDEKKEIEDFSENSNSNLSRKCHVRSSSSTSTSYNINKPPIYISPKSKITIPDRIPEKPPDDLGDDVPIRGKPPDGEQNKNLKKTGPKRDRLSSRRKIGKHRFEDSPFFAFDAFASELRRMPESKHWSEEKIRFWYDSAKGYSESHGAIYANWVAAVKNWDRKDPFEKKDNERRNNATKSFAERSADVVEKLYNESLAVVTREKNPSDSDEINGLSDFGRQDSG